MDFAAMTLDELRCRFDEAFQNTTPRQWLGETPTGPLEEELLWTNVARVIAGVRTYLPTSRQHPIIMEMEADGVWYVEFRMGEVGEGGLPYYSGDHKARNPEVAALVAALELHDGRKKVLERSKVQGV